MHSAITTREMSPSELAECRENLKRQWKNQRVDKELLRRAWETAHRVATVLYQDFGASKVAVFGSLTEQERFTKNSDIDIIVWGISYNKCLDALWETEGLRSEFKIDLIDFETSNNLFRERILNQAIPIDKAEMNALTLMNKTDPATYMEIGELYEVNRDKLIQRISDERTKIDRTIGSITELLQEIEVATPHHRKFFEELTAKKLAEVYSGIERIFERIATEVDKHSPRGNQWHNDLLTQMGERRPERPPVISEVTQRRLRRLLKFRHKVNNIYSNELIYEKAEKHAKSARKLSDSLSEELDAFAAFLIEI